MTLPDKPQIDYSYTGFAAGLGDGSFPGAQVDNDLANLKQAIDETIDFTAGVIRSDGKLANGVVAKESLDSSLLLGVAPPRVWATATVYFVDETVTINNSIYICATAHTSSVFASALVAGFWSLVAEFTVPAAIADDAVTETKHITGGVSTRALADGSVTSVKIGAGAVTAAKLSADVNRALFPVGGEIDYAGFAPPPGWLFMFGQAVSRTTYSALFNALCPGLALTTTAASAVLTNVLFDLRGFGLEGCPISGANIPAGAFIASVAATTITMSVNATGTNANVAARILPWGVGDGATTFNLPDARDRVNVGRGNMGGTAAARILDMGVGATDVVTGRVGASANVERVTNKIIFTGVA
jgi:microcystin-dependent protein